MPEFKTNVLPQRLYNCGESKVDTQIKSGGMFLTVSVSSPMPTFFLNVFFQLLLKCPVNHHKVLLSHLCCEPINCLDFDPTSKIAVMHAMFRHMCPFCFVTCALSASGCLVQLRNNISCDVRKRPSFMRTDFHCLYRRRSRCRFFFCILLNLGYLVESN